MNVVKVEKENGSHVLRTSTKTINRDGTPNKYKKHGAYLISPKGIFRMYYTDNQKRFPILKEVMDI